MPDEPEDAEVIHLEFVDVLEIYAAIIDSTTNQAADHLRDHSGLEGALARPAMHAHYQGADLALQAAVLAHGIAEGRLFIDGNKRTALIALLTFLEINEVQVAATDPELADWILSLSAGATPEQLAQRIRRAIVND